jgi:hypothetical protein
MITYYEVNNHTYGSKYPAAHLVSARDAHSEFVFLELLARVEVTHKQQLAALEHDHLFQHYQGLDLLTS